jgi:hypothetical protein
MDGIEDTMRETRSFGCNGPKQRKEERCRKHCRSHGYNIGVCSEITNYQDCVCSRSSSSKSSRSKSKFIKLSKVFLNISRF